jgi:type IX secretion system PorP/SprF family membrane protein
MKTTIIFFALLFASMSISAQQQPIYNQYFLNQALYNPASIGLGDQVSATLVHKQYLTGFTGNPKTTFLSFSGPLQENKMGIGLNIYSENLGITKKMGVYGAYSYEVQIADSQFLSAGVSLGMLQFSVNPDEMVVDNTEDPLLMNKNFSSSTVDGSFGLSYRVKGLKLGLGVNQMFGSSNKLSDEINYTLERNFFGSASYQFYVDGSRDVSLTPVLMARFSKSKMPQEGALVLGYKEVVWLAPAYKNTGAMSISAAFLAFDGLKVGYSYETAARNNAQSYQNGSHEVLISYSFTALSKSLRQQQKKIDELDNMMVNCLEVQTARDALQDKITEELMQGTEVNSAEIERSKSQLKVLDEKVEKNTREVEELKADLVKSGLLKTDDAAAFTGQEKGHFVVVSSIHDKNYRESAMQTKYLSKGYKQLYNESTGWHYVYQVKSEDLATALQALKQTRAGVHDSAWIFILE